MIKIRTATLDDLEDITTIYNYAINETVATCDAKPKTVEEQKKWFKDHGSKNPIIVAETDEEIVGWAALSRYSTKCAYSDTAEISLYVKEGKQGKGIGKMMGNILYNIAWFSGFRIFSTISINNVASFNSHKANNYLNIIRELSNNYYLVEFIKSND